MISSRPPQGRPSKHSAFYNSHQHQGLRISIYSKEPSSSRGDSTAVLSRTRGRTVNPPPPSSLLSPLSTLSLHTLNRRFPPETLLLFLRELPPEERALPSNSPYLVFLNFLVSSSASSAATKKVVRQDISPFTSASQKIISARCSSLQKHALSQHVASSRARNEAKVGSATGSANHRRSTVLDIRHAIRSLLTSS